MKAGTDKTAPPIYVLIGTKAQYIKTAPLLRLMQERGIDYVLIDSGQNTNVEAMYFNLRHAAEDTPGEPFALMTIHRVETILNRSRLTRVVELALQIAERTRLVLVLHDPTVVKLRHHGLMDKLAGHPQIETTGLVDHKRFLRLIEHALFVVTDGGSIQEECHYLDVPCLVMRSETERQEGIGSNVVIAGFDDAKISAFLEGHQGLRRGYRVENLRPSETILEATLAKFGA